MLAFGRSQTPSAFESLTIGSLQALDMLCSGSFIALCMSIGAVPIYENVQTIERKRFFSMFSDVVVPQPSSLEHWNPATFLYLSIVRTFSLDWDCTNGPANRYNSLHVKL
jgi:hypothetical protein